MLKTIRPYIIPVRMFLRKLGIVLFAVGFFPAWIATNWFEQVRAFSTPTVPHLGTFIAWGFCGTAVLGVLLVGCNLTAGVE